MVRCPCIILVLYILYLWLPKYLKKVAADGVYIYITGLVADYELQSSCLMIITVLLVTGATDSAIVWGLVCFSVIIHYNKTDLYVALYLM